MPAGQSQLQCLPQLCTTFVHNDTYDGFVDRNPLIFLPNRQQHEADSWLKLASFFYEGTNMMIILDNCPASKDVKEYQLVGTDSANQQHQKSFLRKVKRRSPSEKPSEQGRKPTTNSISLPFFIYFTYQSIYVNLY